MAKRIVLYGDDYKELKDLVIRRDKGKCRKCGSSKMVSAHHIQFRSDGGDDKSSNLVTLCGGGKGCHDSVHSKVSSLFITIVDPESDLIKPNADGPLKFKSYTKVGKRVRWRL